MCHTYFGLTSTQRPIISKVSQSYIPTHASFTETQVAITSIEQQFGKKPTKVIAEAPDHIVFLVHDFNDITTVSDSKNVNNQQIIQ
jgi:hypothetical protein